MVAAKRIKQLVQLSAIGLVLLTFLIFVQWEDVSPGTRLKRRVFDLGDQDEEELLAALERELNVDRILKEVQKNVSLRLEEKELQRHKVKLNHRRRLVHNGNGSDGFSDSLVNTTFPNSLETADTRPKVSHPGNKPLNDPKASREQTHRRHLKDFKWRTEPWGSHMFGQLNVHVWQGWCGNTIHDLRRNWFFPLYPDLRLTVSRFYVTHYENDYGQRIFGYLHPPLTGKYLFAISSDDSSELWLSSDEHPENVKPVAWVGNQTSYSGRYRTNIAEFTKYNTQLSKQIYLKKGQKYFIEALHKQGARLDHILVGWKIPGLPGFRYITGNSISLYIYDADASPDVTEYSRYIPQTLASHTHSHNWSVVLDREVHKFGTNERPEVENHKRRPPFVNLNNLFYRCKYKPSYLVNNFTLRRYEGVGLIHDSAVYPDDNTALTHMRPFDKCGHRRRSTDSHGNDLNLTNSKPGNQSLYDEGSIKVFGSDGEGSVVTTPSDLTEAYPMEGNSLEDGNRLSSNKPIERSLQERVRIVVDVYKEMNSSRTETQQDETIQFNDPRKSFHENGNQLEPRNDHHGNINPGKLETRNNSNMNTIQFKHRNSYHRNDNSRDHYHDSNNDIAAPKQVVSRHRGAILNLAKKIHDRYKRVQKASRDVNYVRDVRIHMEQAVLRDDGQPNWRQSPRITRKKYVPSIDDKHEDEDVRLVDHAANMNNQDSEPSNQDSQPFHQDLQPANQDSQPVNPVSEQYIGDSNQAREDPKRRATLRKLMFVSEDPQQVSKAKTRPSEEDEDGDGPHIQPPKSLQMGKDVIYFRPGIATNASVLSKDSMLQRVYAAREYIRRMQKIVQIYKYDVTSKQLSDQIYRRFGIRMLVPELRFYSDYNPWLYHHNITKCGTDGNILLNEDVAHSVVMRYMKSVDRQRPHQFRLERIINIQENHDIINGDRYLIELEVFHHETNQKARVSQYIYQEIGYADFCTPQNFQIHHHATVHVIIPVKNQGRWVQYFIDDMSELFVKTGDPHLNVIIVDFSSDDIDIEEALKRSPLVRYRVITLTGPFQRAFGIQAGAAVITNPNDIIFMCDLHLEIPNDMIDIIRKHCIQGRMAFAPIVLRLHCGFTPTIPYGFWELQGYGLFAMYKSDFDRVGGMNYREFGTRWGGEDWELLDRVLLNKMEVERLRVPNFYHFYHSKKGMWGSPTIDIIHSDIGGQYYRNKNQIIPLYRPKPTRKTKIYDSRTINIKDKQRNLRMKRSPSRVVRQSSRFRRGYRPKQNPRGTDNNGARIYY